MGKTEKSTFLTLTRQRQAILPSSKASHYPKLQQVSEPHIGSFNAIFSYQSSSLGLFDLALEDIPHKFVFDGTPDAPTRNKLESMVYG
jgi:DNA-directed RNA polymerase I subunit RPA2